MRQSKPTLRTTRRHSRRLKQKYPASHTRTRGIRIPAWLLAGCAGFFLHKAVS